jgi:hypothetical protein
VPAPNLLTYSPHATYSTPDPLTYDSTKSAAPLPLPACRRHLSSSRRTSPLLPGSSIIFVVCPTHILPARAWPECDPALPENRRPGKPPAGDVCLIAGGTKSLLPLTYSARCFLPLLQKDFFRFPSALRLITLQISLVCTAINAESPCFPTKEYNKGIRKGRARCCICEKNSRSGRCLFVGGSRAALSLEAVALRARLPPTTRLLSSWLYRSTVRSDAWGGLTHGMPPANSFPLTLSWQEACSMGVLPHAEGLLPGTCREG